VDGSSQDLSSWGTGSRSIVPARFLPMPVASIGTSRPWKNLANPPLTQKLSLPQYSRNNMPKTICGLGQGFYDSTSTQYPVTRSEKVITVKNLNFLAWLGNQPRGNSQPRNFVWFDFTSRKNWLITPHTTPYYVFHQTYKFSLEPRNIIKVDRAVKNRVQREKCTLCTLRDNAPGHTYLVY